MGHRGKVRCFTVQYIVHSFTLVQTRSTRARVAPLTEHSKFCCFVVVCLVVKVIHIR